MRMESRIHVITLAVPDLDRALAFYREGLGLDSAGVIGTEFVGSDESPAGDVAMFHLDGNLILLCTRARSWRKMRAYRLGRRSQASSASDISFLAAGR